MMYATPRALTLVLGKRFGFVREALQHGVPLVPCFAFGENDVFMQNVSPPGSWIRNLQDFLKRVFTFSFPRFYGRGMFNYNIGMLPLRKPVTVVVGSPVEPEDGPIASPTTDDILRLHKKYVEALINLFETHKLNYGYNEADHLEII